LSQFLYDTMNIDLDGMCVQRVHRLGSMVKARRTSQTPRRPIIAAFRDYRDTEYIMQNATKLFGSRYGIDRDYPKEIAMARKRLWEHQKSSYKSGENVKIVFPAKLIVNGRCVADEFPDWQEILSKDRLQFVNQVPSSRNVYSIDTDIGQSSVVPNSSTTIPVIQSEQISVNGTCPTQEHVTSVKPANNGNTSQCDGDQSANQNQPTTNPNPDRTSPNKSSSMSGVAHQDTPPPSRADDTPGPKLGTDQQ